MWKSRLDHLGLGHWDLTVRVVEELVDNPDAWATCEPHEMYDSAIIEFVHDIPDEQLDRVIVHELLHIFYRDFWRVIELPTFEVSKGEGALLRSQLRHELEGVVDRMARCLTYDMAKLPPAAMRVNDEPGTLVR
jgi:hypothetical protein